MDALAKGDRLYFDGPRLGRGSVESIDHAGVHLGEGRFIHATPPEVTIETLADCPYARYLCRAMRDEPPGEAEGPGAW